MESPLAVSNYFIQKSFDSGYEVTPMKLIKLVYISHGWHLAIMNSPLINEAVQAWKYGPVIDSVYKNFKPFGNSVITSLATIFSPTYSIITPSVNESEKEFLDSIWEAYKKYNGVQLSTLTHQPNTPWDIIWNQRGGKDLSSAIIPNDIIESHYKDKINKINARSTATDAATATA